MSENTQDEVLLAKLLEASLSDIATLRSALYSVIRIERTLVNLSGGVRERAMLYSKALCDIRDIAERALMDAGS